MDNKYVPKKEFKVYIIGDIHSDFGEGVYGLTYTGQTFPEYELAKEWINDNGERKTDYTIVDVFAKP